MNLRWNSYITLPIPIPIPIHIMVLKTLSFIGSYLPTILTKIPKFIVFVLFYLNKNDKDSKEILMSL